MPLSRSVNFWPPDISCVALPGICLAVRMVLTLSLHPCSIEMHTRRRNRINGVSRPARAPPGGLFVQVQEAFGNCPKYITRRVLSSPSQGAGLLQGEAAPVKTQSLTSDQQRLIAEADMMFVATASPGGGADATHRGGSPGFVRFLDERTLVWPDYTGNGMFMVSRQLDHRITFCLI